MRRLLSASAVLIVLAGCATPRPVPVAAPRPVPVPVSTPTPAPLAADWRDWPLTPGDWRYASYNGRTSATFGASDPGLLTLSCTAEHTIRVTMTGANTAPVTIRTTSVTRTMPTAPVGNPAAASLVTLAARDPLLDAVAFSRGRFIVEQAGHPTLVIPAYAEIGRVIEDCRG